jgi:hypothetical protein
MKGILGTVAAIAAILVAASACASSHSAMGTAHAEAAQKPARLNTTAKVRKILVDQGQIPPVRTAADFCLKGILKDEKDTLVSKAIDVVDPAAGDVWSAYSLSGDLDDTVTLYKRDGEFAGTFQLGQFLASLISSFGQKATAGTPLEFQFYLFGVLGEAAVYCAEAAWWLDGTVGGQLGSEIRHVLPPPSAQCVLVLPDQTYCRSTDPTVILEAENVGDTSDCTFSDTIYWSDGSPPQTVVYQGADDVPEVVASHTYKQLSAYGITADVTVVDGPCTAINGGYTFAYVTDG